MARFLSAFVRAVKPASAGTKRLLWADLLQLGETNMQGHYNALFLCTGNSARSIMAEAILNFKGRPNFTGLQRRKSSLRNGSTGSIETARNGAFPTEGLRSKAWDEFSLPGSPKLDFVFTVCDNAAKEVCPIWPGQPMTAHWGVPDPAAVHGSEAEVERAFREAFFILERRISSIALSSAEDSRQPCTQEGTRQHRADDGPITHE
jgi:arsenate reductase (thioredoxin)